MSELPNTIEEWCQTPAHGVQALRAYRGSLRRYQAAAKHYEEQARASLETINRVKALAYKNGWEVE